jgi:hypothetical protein
MLRDHGNLDIETLESIISNKLRIWNFKQLNICSYVLEWQSFAEQYNHTWRLESFEIWRHIHANLLANLKKENTCSIYDSTNAWRDNVF